MGFSVHFCYIYSYDEVRQEKRIKFGRIKLPTTLQLQYTTISSPNPTDRLSHLPTALTPCDDLLMCVPELNQILTHSVLSHAQCRRHVWPLLCGERLCLSLSSVHCCCRAML